MKIISLIYYFRKALNDLTKPLVYEIADINNSQTLNEYYFVFNSRELLEGGSYQFNFDSNGIPMVKGHFADTDGSYFYNPQAVGQFALATYHDYLETKKDEYLERFLRIARWYRDNFALNKGIPYWPSNEKKVHKVYGEDSRGHVISCMSQSRAISVMLRAYQVSGDENYLLLSEKALNAYELPPEQGGFNDTDGENVFFEEASQPRILNHIIFSMFGLYDYCRVKNFDTHYMSLFNKSLNTIENVLNSYDTGWWSLYDNYYDKGVRRINPCTRHYHNIHIKQLEVLYDLSLSGIIKKYLEAWRKYDQSRIKRVRMLANKTITVKKMKRI